jgi:hypothetical protein
MRSLGRLLVGVVVGAIVIALCAAAVGAEPDARIKPLIDQMKAFIEKPEPVFLRQRIDIAVNGQKQNEQLQEVWIRDLDHLRVERSDGTVVVLTPEDIKMYVGPARLLVHIPKETLEALGDQKAEKLRVLDITQPRDNITVMMEGWELMQVTGEDKIGDEACWVLTAGPELFPRFRKILAGIPEDFDLKTVQVALGRESAMGRAMFFEFAGPAQLEVGVTVEEIEEGVEVTDEMLVFEAPEEALVLTWTPDKTAEEMRAARDTAIAERVEG